MDFPQTKTQNFTLVGGLDVETAQYSRAPGLCMGGFNYESSQETGYERIGGYERFDGRTPPSSASYYLMPANVLLAGIGQTITGVGSGATAKVIGTYSSGLVLGRLTGSFSASEVYGNVSRASTGTYFNSSGVLSTAGVNVPRVNYNPANLSAAPVLMAEAAATNLLLYSEQFEQPPHGAWQCQPVSTNVAIAPNGTMTADKLIENATTNGHSFNYGMSVTAGVTYNRSVHLKAGERTWAVVGFATHNGAFPSTLVKVNLLTGAITTLVGTPINPVCVDAGGGWWRVGLSCTAIASVWGGFYFGTFNGAEAYLGDGVSGLYAWGEQIEIGSTMTSYIPTTSAAVTRAAETAYAGGVVTSPQTANSAAAPADDADYLQLAANDLRLDIGSVPGSGPGRGVAVLNGTVYAFRDNAGATALGIYKSTSSGWSAITLYKEVSFTAGSGAAPAEGATITKGGVSATVKRVVLQTGTWAGGTAAGRFILSNVTGGSFSAGAFTAGVAATCSGAETQISLLPGGRLDHVVYNFTGSTTTERIYGCDGVNPGFEFDGDVLVPIRTGMTLDTPRHVACHRNHLFFAFKGSAQHSGIQAPYQWTVVTGAAELTVGQDITGFANLPGDVDSAPLMIFSDTRTTVIYGSSSADWKPTTYSTSIGAQRWSAQNIGNPVVLNSLGITPVIQTAEFGNFVMPPASDRVRAYLKSKITTASVVNRGVNRLRYFFSDGDGMSVTAVGDKLSFMPIHYGTMVVRCATEANISGVSRNFFMSDDGYVYEGDVGRSFDGSAIEAWIKLAFNHVASPMLKKRFRKVSIEAKPQSACSLSLQGEYSLGAIDISPTSVASISFPGSGGLYDISNWDQCYYDTPAQTVQGVRLDGVGTSLSLTIYHTSAKELPHLLQSVTTSYTPRRLER